MKVIHNCSVFKFHEEYCTDIHEELLRRGHESIICDDYRAYWDDADFTIQPDEACTRMGGRGVWIGHAFPVVPQNAFYTEPKFKADLQKNSDFIFTFSEAWAEWHEMHGLSIKVVGMPRLDKLFNNINGKWALYAPTHHKKSPNVYAGDKIAIMALERYGFCIRVRPHPAYSVNPRSVNEDMMEAGVVISDYSSIYLESIVLNIPTILIGDARWGVDNSHISGCANEAAIVAHSQEEMEMAVIRYINDPLYLEEERLRHSKMLCEYQGVAASRFVDVLEELL